MSSLPREDAAGGGGGGGGKSEGAKSPIDPNIIMALYTEKLHKHMKRLHVDLNWVI